MKDDEALQSPVLGKLGDVESLNGLLAVECSPLVAEPATVRIDRACAGGSDRRERLPSFDEVCDRLNTGERVMAADHDCVLSEDTSQLASPPLIVGDVPALDEKIDHFFSRVRHVRVKLLERPAHFSVGGL